MNQFQSRKAINEKIGEYISQFAKLEFGLAEIQSHRMSMEQIDKLINDLY